MTTRLKNLMQTVCIVLILMLFPSTARLQEQKEPAPPQTAAPQADAPVVPPAEPATVPPAEEKIASPAPAPAAEPAAAPAPPAAEKTAVPAPAPAEETRPPYLIKQGDTLWDIANTFLKDPFLWPFIWKANPAITNPDLIFAGNNLVIPEPRPDRAGLEG